MRAWWAGQTYLDHVRQLDLPSTAQGDAFAEFATNAHSWYKHLPLFPPGARFVFFLDQNAGFEEEWKREGPFGGRWKRHLRPRTKERCFHHNHLPTEQYRELFGAWTYSVIHDYPLLVRRLHRASSMRQLRRRITRYLHSWRSDRPPMDDYIDPLYRQFPCEALEQCGCQVTGFVHSDGELFPHLLQIMICKPEDERYYPSLDHFLTYGAAHPEDLDVRRYQPLAEFLVEGRKLYSANKQNWYQSETFGRLAKEIERFVAGFHEQEHKLLLDRVKTTLREARAFFARLRDVS